MYTQCPECDVAFRVTADVLKQAAGKVRCGGCGVAFNALMHLSEEMPAPTHPDPEPDIPEYSFDEPGELEADTPPKSISAEQSAALLKTLDQLAGEDIRIEDTGVEWRVLAPNEEPEDEPEIDATSTVAHEEMRFDDNTPLPDDFDLDALSSPAPAPEPVIEVAEPERSIEDSQVDLAFGEPDEWEDLLDDLEEQAAALGTTREAIEAESSEELPVDVSAPEAPVADLKLDETDISEEIAALPDIEEIEAAVASDADVPLDMDTQFAIQAEAMGIDLSGIHAKADEAEAEDEASAEEPELAGSAEPDEEHETSIDEDLIAAAFEVEAAAKAASAIEELPSADDSMEEEAIDEEIVIENVDLEDHEPEFDESGEIDLDDVAPEDLSRAGILDEDDYLEVITEDDEVAADAAESDEQPEAAALEEQLELDELQRELDELEHETEEPEAVEPEESAQDEAELEEDVEEAEEAELDDVPDKAELEAELAAAALEEDPAAIEQVDEIDGETDLGLDAFDGSYTGFGDDLESGMAMFSEPEIGDVPEPTEEEKTINMMIDQDLLAIAMEDEDGFTSTIVQKQVSDKNDIPREKAAANFDFDENDDKKEMSLDEMLDASQPMPAPKASPLMETIIMEGDFVRSEEEAARLDADRKAASVSLQQSKAEDDRKTRRHWEPPRFGMVAGVGILAIVLILQLVHQSREALATSETFQKTVAPVYRMVGSPVTPAWDVTGWRFEATKGSTAEEDGVLTIYSRIGNTSDSALPYPLVHVSLTDRFEEIIGSRVLEPAEYLVGDVDPRHAVPPKENFDAVITIESPSVDATGFKLNVCYRLSSGQLRCAIEDFK